MGSVLIIARFVLYKVWGVLGVLRYSLVVIFGGGCVVMFEIALVVLVEFVLFFMEKFLVKKRGKKSVGLTGGSRKVFGSFVFKLIIEVFLVF